MTKGRSTTSGGILAGMTVEPDPLSRQLVPTWDAGAESYDSIPRHGIRHDDERRAWRRLVAAILGDPSHAAVPRLRVLDVGTGTGVLALLAAELGHDVTGLDLSPGMLSVARRRALDSRLGVTWIEGDAAAPPVEPASFDAILARHLVWTLPAPGRTLEAWRSVVVPGGLIAVIDGWYPSPPLPGRVAGGLARRWLASHPRAGAHEHPYLPEQLARLPLAHQSGTTQIVGLLRGAGLTHVRVRPLPEVDRVERAHQGALERLADPWRRYLATAQRPRS